jgi:hypothetical protein
MIASVIAPAPAITRAPDDPDDPDDPAAGGHPPLGPDIDWVTSTWPTFLR